MSRFGFPILIALVSLSQTALAWDPLDTIELTQIDQSGAPLEDGPQLKVGDSSYFEAKTLPSPLDEGASYLVKKPADEAMKDAAKESTESENGTAKASEGLPPFVVDVSVKKGALFLKVEWLRFGDWSLEGHELWQMEPEKKRIGVFSGPQIRIHTAIAQDDEKPTEPFPMLGPVGLGLPAWLMWAIIGAVVATLVVLMLVLIRWSRKNKMVAPVIVTKPLAPIDERAMGWISDLERERLWEKGELKRHYFRLSEIAKTYLGERYTIDALESTTRELMEMIERGKLVEETKLDGLEKLFSEMDLVKFTDLKPAEDAPRRHLEEVRKLVQTTRIIRVAPIQTDGPVVGASVGKPA